MPGTTTQMNATTKTPSTIQNATTESSYKINLEYTTEDVKIVATKKPKKNNVESGLIQFMISLLSVAVLIAVIAAIVFLVKKKPFWKVIGPYKVLDEEDLDKKLEQTLEEFSLEVDTEQEDFFETYVE
jgi:hypothetical protein